MTQRPGRARLDQSGFTLVELLAAISILGIISFALTEAIVVGVKTTEGTGDRISGSVATQGLTSYFSGDAASADTVSTEDTTCATRDPGSAGAKPFLKLQWTDQGVTNVATYGLDPATGRDVDVVRWSCTDTAPGSYDRKIIGHFSSGSAAVTPVTASCGPTACSATDSKPATITLTIKPDAKSDAQQLTISPRSGRT